MATRYHPYGCIDVWNVVTGLRETEYSTLCTIHAPRRWFLGIRKRPKVTEAQVANVIADAWHSGAEVAQILRTRQYGQIYRHLHHLYEDGRAADRWVPTDNPKTPEYRQYRLVTKVTR